MITTILAVLVGVFLAYSVVITMAAFVMATKTKTLERDVEEWTIIAQSANDAGTYVHQMNHNFIECIQASITALAKHGHPDTALKLQSAMLARMKAIPQPNTERVERLFAKLNERAAAQQDQELEKHDAAMREMIDGLDFDVKFDDDEKGNDDAD